MNVLTEHVEELARQHKTFDVFEDHATTFLRGVINSRIKLSADVLELARELGLKEEEAFLGGQVLPSIFGKAKRDGISVSRKSVLVVRDRLKISWDSWNV